MRIFVKKVRFTHLAAMDTRHSTRAQHATTTPNLHHGRHSRPQGRALDGRRGRRALSPSGTAPATPAPSPTAVLLVISFVLNPRLPFDESIDRPSTATAGPPSRRRCPDAPASSARSAGATRSTPPSARTSGPTPRTPWYARSRDPFDPIEKNAPRAGAFFSPPGTFYHPRPPRPARSPPPRLRSSLSSLPSLFSQLQELVNTHGLRWADIARSMPGRTDQQCMGRWRRHLDPGISREQWSTEDLRRRSSASARHELGNHLQDDEERTACWACGVVPGPSPGGTSTTKAAPTPLGGQGGEGGGHQPPRWAEDPQAQRRQGRRRAPQRRQHQQPGHRQGGEERLGQEAQAPPPGPPGPTTRANRGAVETHRWPAVGSRARGRRVDARSRAHHALNAPPILRQGPRRIDAGGVVRPASA